MRLAPKCIERATCLPLSREANGGVENEDDQNRDRFRTVARDPCDRGSNGEKSNHDACKLIDEYTPGGASLDSLKGVATVLGLSFGDLGFCEASLWIDVEQLRDRRRGQRMPAFLVIVQHKLNVAKLVPVGQL